MNLASSLRERIETLVHPAAAVGTVERTRHILFIALNLAFSLLALLAIPLRLGFGVPGPLELIATLSLQAPMLAAVLTMRGQSLRSGYALSAAGFITFVVLLASAAARIESAGPALLLLAAAVAPALLYAAAVAWISLRLETAHDEKTRHETAHHCALVLACGDLVLRIDRRGAVLSCNNAAGHFPALTARDLSGPGLYERLHLADRPAFLQALSDAFNNRVPGVAILRLRTAMVRSARGDFQEPVYSTIEARMRCIDSEAAPDETSAVCLLRDITAQLARENEGLVAQRLAERAEVTQERFLANVSHELRTPLNAIIGFADLLRLDSVPKDDAKRTEYADIIAASGQHLLSVVNSILDMSKLESGSLEIEPTQFDPVALLDSCLDIVRLKAAETGVVLLRQYDAALAPIVGDERACRQIVINLLSNAVKFTAQGGIVTLAARSDFGLSVTVDDTGIGIAADDMPRIGDAFYQASNARSRLFEGTGLGLSLVRGLVGLHGGAIDIESAPGAGTAVTVRLPADCRSSSVLHTPVTIRTASRRKAAPYPSSHHKVKHVA